MAFCRNSNLQLCYSNNNNKSQVIRAMYIIPKLALKVSSESEQLSLVESIQTCSFRERFHSVPSVWQFRPNAVQS